MTIWPLRDEQRATAFTFWRSVRRGFDSLTLDPSPQLNQMRRDAELRQRQARERLLNSWKPLPPLPDSACPPASVPLGTSRIPGEDA